ncbi:hypothetical protein AN478_07305 [Thiohalorhabdus denitrificans]|nr:hypothetical protein AN478_07305 [Thiohalorhabdus denitrificans]
MLGGEQGVEVGGQAGPVFGQLGRVLRAGKGVQQGVHEGPVGAELVAGLLLQAVAESHELVDFLSDSGLFLNWWNRDGNPLPFTLI